MKSRVLFNAFLFTALWGASIPAVYAEPPKEERATGLKFETDWELSGYMDAEAATELSFTHLNGGAKVIKVKDDDGLLTLRTLQASMVGPAMRKVYSKFRENGGKVDRAGNPTPMVAVDLAGGEYALTIKNTEVENFAQLKPALLSALDRWSKMTAKEIKRLKAIKATRRTAAESASLEKMILENEQANGLYEYFENKDTATYDNIQSSLGKVLADFLSKHSYTDSNGESFRLTDTGSEHPLSQLFTSQPITVGVETLKMGRGNQMIGLAPNVFTDNVLRQKKRGHEAPEEVERDFTEDNIEIEE